MFMLILMKIPKDIIKKNRKVNKAMNEYLKETGDGEEDIIIVSY